MKITIMFLILIMALNVGYTQSVGDMAPDFEAVDVEGNQQSISKYKGSVVLLKFWASWCGPCVTSLPGSWEKHQKYNSRGLVIFTVGLGGKQRDMVMLNSKGYKFPVMIDRKSINGDLPYNFRGIPHELLISRTGKILFVGHPARLTDAMIETALNEGAETTQRRQYSRWQVRLRNISTRVVRNFNVNATTRNSAIKRAQKLARNNNWNRTSVVSVKQKQKRDNRQERTEQTQSQANWELKADSAQYGGADWKNQVKRVNGITVEEAKRIAEADKRITFFFITKGGQMVLPGKGVFRTGDTVFFSGKPWLGSAPDLADTYIKASSSESENLSSENETQPQVQEETSGNRWNSSMYSRFNYTNFQNSSLAKQPINFNNIDYELLGAAIFYATNIERAKHNRPLFKPSMVLYKAAFIHSKDMAERNFFSHTSPIAGRSTPSDRVKLYGQWIRTVGENIAYTFGIQYRAGTSVSSFANIPPHSYWSFALSVVDSWMNSPGHRRNILNAAFGRLGAAGYLEYKMPHRIPYFKATQVFAGDTND